MPSRTISMEEVKDPNIMSRTNQPRVFPQRLLHMLLAFLILCLSFTFFSVYMIRYFRVYNPVTTMVGSNFRECFEAPHNLKNWIKPPSNLMHTMTDKELFWRATFVPRIKKHPFKRTPKMAFMFLTKGPLPLAPLWDRFFKGHQGLYSIYIHSLPSYQPDFSSSSVFYKRQIPSQISEWGKMSICDAERRLVANALLDISNEWFVLVSESCIPLYNFTVIYQYISRSKQSFVGAFDDPGPYGRGRYNPNMEPEVNITHWRKGSQWFQVNRKLAIYIVEDSTYYAKFSKFCKPACYVDEHYFPTMLTIQASNVLANRSLTLVDWSRGGAHPATFGGEDISIDFLKRMLEGHNCGFNSRNSSICYVFARKFAPSSLEALLWVASKYFGY